MGVHGNTGRLTLRLAAVRTPTYGDIRQAAGFLEGEGTFGSVKNGGYFCMKVAASQKNPWILHWMRERFGGSILIQSKPAGDYFIWCVNGTRARGVALTLYTFLSPWRREQCKKALQGDFHRRP